MHIFQNCEYVVRLTSRDGSVIEIVPEDPMAPSSRTRIFASDSGMYLEDFSVGNIKVCLVIGVLSVYFALYCFKVDINWFWIRLLLLQNAE